VAAPAYGAAREQGPYAGLVTRAIAMAVDAAIVNLTAIGVGVVAGLALSIFHIPDKTRNVLLVVGSGLFVLWTIAYFVTLWSTTGQTAGDRLMRIRVRQADADEPLRAGWALVRLGGIVIAAVPLLLGFLPILLTDRRRGLQDYLARSVVVTAEPTDLEWS
jgi:uncharacterized RDD family membrane protein YckC